MHRRRCHVSNAAPMSENGETTCGALLFFRAESAGVTYGQMARDRMLDYEEDVDGIGGGCRGVWRVG